MTSFSIRFDRGTGEFDVKAFTLLPEATS